MDSLRPLAQLKPDGSLRALFYYEDKPNVPEAMEKEGTLYRIVSDHLGSVRLVLNANTGAIAQQMDYDAWGPGVSMQAPGRVTAFVTECNALLPAAPGGRPLCDRVPSLRTCSRSPRGRAAVLSGWAARRGAQWIARLSTSAATPQTARQGHCPKGWSEIGRLNAPAACMGMSPCGASEASTHPDCAPTRSPARSSTRSKNLNRQACAFLQHS